MSRFTNPADEAAWMRAQNGGPIRIVTETGDAPLCENPPVVESEAVEVWGDFSPCVGTRRLATPLKVLGAGNAFRGGERAQMIHDSQHMLDVRARVHVARMVQVLDKVSARYEGASFHHTAL